MIDNIEYQNELCHRQSSPKPSNDVEEHVASIDYSHGVRTST
jgi:hypothetical protein